MTQHAIRFPNGYSIIFFNACVGPDLPPHTESHLELRSRGLCGHRARASAHANRRATQQQLRRSSIKTTKMTTRLCGNDVLITSRAFVVGNHDVCTHPARLVWLRKVWHGWCDWGCSIPLVRHGVPCVACIGFVGNGMAWHAGVGLGMSWRAIRPR